MLAKKHEYNNQTILAVCDKELLGKTFEEGELSFTASVKFYGGDEINEQELLELLKEADSANLFGNKCIEILKKQGLINENQLISISGIKHTQIYNI